MQAWLPVGGVDCLSEAPVPPNSVVVSLFTIRPDKHRLDEVLRTEQQLRDYIAETGYH